jgi:hypothetical protein
MALTKPEKQHFAATFVTTFLQGGFGSMSKREIELLVFHLLSNTRDYKKKSNYELASALRIPESRVKSMRLSSALRYSEINSIAVLHGIVLRLRDNQQHLNLEESKIEISLEDPIERREIENFLKLKGHHAEYHFNSEVLRIAPIRLFELIVETLENGEQEFNNLIQNSIEDDAASNRILRAAPNFQQKVTRLREEALSSATLATLIAGALGLVGG